MMTIDLLHNLADSCTAQGYCTSLPTSAANSSNLQALLQIVFAIFGAVTVLIIVISALNFVNSQGDSSRAAKARSSIIYALVGLVVAVSAEAIVTFTLGKF